MKINLPDIELYFSVFGYPSEDIEIIPGMYVLCINAQFFVESSILCLKNHPGNMAYKPYWDHLFWYFKKVKELSK